MSTRLFALPSGPGPALARHVVLWKSIDALKGIHSAQMLTYMRLTDARHGLLMNFNCSTLKSGLKSFVGRGKLLPNSGSPGNQLPTQT